MDTKDHEHGMERMKREATLLCAELAKTDPRWSEMLPKLLAAADIFDKVGDMLEAEKAVAGQVAFLAVMLFRSSTDTANNFNRFMRLFQTAEICCCKSCEDTRVSRSMGHAKGNA